MKTIKFDTNVYDGKIVVPEVYQDSLKQAKGVTVIIKIKDNSSLSEETIEQLMKHPIPIEKLTPMSREAIHERD